MRTFLLVVSLASVSIATVASAQAPATADRVQWVAQALERMQTIKVGMTRDDLMKVFTTEGGISSRRHRTFVSRDCPYFKVDVAFEAVGTPDVDRTENGQDRIVQMSRPYLQFSIMD